MNPCQTLDKLINDEAASKFNNFFLANGNRLKGKENDIISGLIGNAELLDTFNVDFNGSMRNTCQALNKITGQTQLLSATLVGMLEGNILSFFQFLAFILIYLFDPDGKLVSMQTALRYGGHGLLFLVLAPVAYVMMFYANAVIELF